MIRFYTVEECEAKIAAAKTEKERAHWEKQKRSMEFRRDHYGPGYEIHDCHHSHTEK